MELGATHCVPRAPQCSACPVAAHCLGRQSGTAAQLPVKLRKKEPVAIAGTLVIVERRGELLLRRRSTGRMVGFWELPERHDLEQLLEGPALGEFRHTITHHHFTYRVILGEIRRRPKGFQWIARARLGELPVSTTVRKALRLVPESQNFCKTPRSR